MEGDKDKQAEQAGTTRAERRRKRKPKGTADGTRTSESPGPKNSVGTAAHDNPVDTRQRAFLVRPSSPLLEMDGRKYSGYGDASPRVDLPLMVVAPTTFNIRGWRGITSKAGNVVGGPYDAIPGLQRVATIAENLYEEVVYMGEARDGFKQLPPTLKTSGFMIDYIQRYMLVVAKLVSLISLQQLATYDIVSRRIGLVGSAVSRTKLKTALEIITSLPMYPAFHNLAVLMGTPIVPGTPTGPILVRTFPFSFPNFSTFGDDADTVGLPSVLHHVIKGVGDSDTATTLLDRTAKLHDSSWWNDEYSDIMNLIKATQRVDIDGDHREDMLAMQGLLRILNVPTNYMSYPDVVPAIASPLLLDTHLNYGLYAGHQDVSSGTDQRVLGPDANWTGGMVEMRYPGAVGIPHMLGMFGSVFGTGGYHDIDEESTGGYQFGIMGEGADAGSTDPTATDWKNQCQLMVRRIYREDTGVSDVWSKVSKDAKEQDEFKNYPLAQHWWRDVATAGSADPDIHRDNAEDAVVFVPVEDFGYHFLRWFTSSLGVPTRL